jgi:hypothetical protein
MRSAVLVVLTALALASCVSPSAGPSAPGRPGGIEFGDLQRASQRSVASRFSGGIERRYRQGAPLSEVVADLRANRFTCAPGQPTRRGVAPSQICRRSLRDRGCVHTWQVHIFAALQSLTRTRALYDRACEGDGLLGGRD